VPAVLSCGTGCIFEFERRICYVGEFNEEFIMTVHGSERQEKIFRAWADALQKQVSDLSASESIDVVRQSVAEAEASTGHSLQDMDQRDLSDPAKARFVGTVVSVLYRKVASLAAVENAESLRKLLIDVYQQFPDHSE
jgi:hypothetical protein